MKELIVYKNEDGTCAIVVPVDPNLSIEEIIAKDVPEGKEYRVITDDKIPSDRYFRNAWTDDLDTDTVDIDMEKARGIQMNYIRRARNAALVDLDLEANIALGKTDLKELGEINQKKQVLRDIPQTFDLTVFETPEDLKLAMPEELLEE